MVCVGMFGGGNVVVDKYKRILAIYRCFLLYTIIGIINVAKCHNIYKPSHDNRSNKKA